jgi:hypothetical protein
METKLKLGSKPTKEEDESLDQETLQRMLMTGENTKGMFTSEPEEEKDKPEAEEPVGSGEFGKVREKFGKYQKQMFEDMKKNPQDYLINTPKGVMPVTEAIKKGYNPLTKQFEDDKDQDKRMGKIFEEEGVGPEEAQRLQQMLGMQQPAMPPAQEGMPPDGELPPGAEGMAPQQEQPTNESQQQAAMAAMMGGMK